MALRELLLSLGVDVDKGGVKKADAALGKMKKAAVVAAAAFAALKAGAAILAGVDAVRSQGDQIDKTSKQLGISSDALQEWQFAAGLAGASSDEMSNSLAKLQKNAVDAADGGAAMADNFKKLGIDVNDSNGQVKDADTLLSEMSDGFKNLSNDAQRSAIAQELMGRAGKKLIPLLTEGSEGIAKMREEARSLGFIMDKDLIASTVKLTDDQLRSQMAWQGLKNQLAGAVIPIFIKLTNWSLAVAKAISGPLKTAIHVIEVIFEGLMNIINFIIEGWVLIAEVVGDVGVALLGLGAIILIFGKAAVIAAVKTAIAWALAAAPFILIGILIAVLLLAIEDFIVFMKGGDSVIGRLVKRFKGWVRDFGGVGNAMKDLFSKVFQFIFGVGKEKADAIVNVFAGVLHAIKETFVQVGEFIGENLAAAFLAVEAVIKGFVDTFTAAIDFLMEKFDQIIDAAADVIESVAEATGLDSLVDKGATRDFAQERKDKRRDQKANALRAQKRIAVIRKLESEGFGKLSDKRGGKNSNSELNIGLTGVKDQAAAAARFKQLQQNIDAPLTVNVDATNRKDANEVGAVVGKSVRKEQNRQIQGSFVTAGGG